MHNKVGSEYKIVRRFYEKRIRNYFKAQSAQQVVLILWIKSEDKFTFPPTTTQKTKCIVVILTLGYRASYQNTWYGNKNHGKN